MTKFELILSERYDAEHRDAIASRIRTHLPVEAPRSYIRKSAGELPQFIQIIGDAALWKTTLGAAASLFLGAYIARLGYRAAEATADKLAGLFNSRDVQPLAETAKALSEAKLAVGTNATIQIGIGVPSDRAPTILEIAESDPAKIAFAISKFVTRVDEIGEAMASEAAEGRTPAVRATITLLADGSFRLTWQYWSSNYDKIEKGEIHLANP